MKKQAAITSLEDALQATQRLEKIQEEISPVGKEFCNTAIIKSKSINPQNFQKAIPKILAYRELYESLNSFKNKCYYLFSGNQRRSNETRKTILIAGGIVVIVVFWIMRENDFNWSDTFIFTGIALGLSLLALLIFHFSPKEIRKRKENKPAKEIHTKLRYDFQSRLEINKERFEKGFESFLAPLLQIISQDVKAKQNFELSLDFTRKETDKHLNFYKKEESTPKGRRGYNYVSTKFYDIPIFSLRGTFVDGTKIFLGADEYIRSRHFRKYKRKGIKLKYKKKGKTLYKIKLQVPKSQGFIISQKKLQKVF